MSTEDLELDARTRLDPDSQAWMDGLRCSGAERDQALARLHDLLLRAACSEAARRGGSPRLGGLDLDDLARRAAADALRAITAELRGFPGESRFTTWASKFAVSAVAVQAARAAAAPGAMSADDVDDGGWERLPARLGLRPDERAGWHEFAAALRRAAEEELGGKQRRVFTAVTLHDVPVGVLAARLGSSRNAIYMALFEARRTLRARLATDGHDPAHRSGPFTAGARWVDELLAADPGDAGCDVTFQVLDRYVETQLHGQDPGRRFPAVAAHLRGCQACRQDCQGLLAGAGGRPVMPLARSSAASSRTAPPHRL